MLSVHGGDAGFRVSHHATNVRTVRQTHHMAHLVDRNLPQSFPQLRLVRPPRAKAKGGYFGIRNRLLKPAGKVTGGIDSSLP